MPFITMLISLNFIYSLFSGHRRQYQMDRITVSNYNPSGFSSGTEAIYSGTEDMMGSSE